MPENLIHGILRTMILKALDMTTIQVELPDSMDQAGQAAGLLKPQVIERLLRRALRKREAADALLWSADRLAAVGIAPMSMQEINAMVAASRAEHPAQLGAGFFGAGRTGCAPWNT
ncbi:MAG: hypothetical protein ACK5OI_02315 [Curvibacter sp.]|nr:hypothetical protein [Curvibacter sp.]